MNYFTKYKQNWVKKSLISKVSDIFFVVVIIALIIPQSRIELLGFGARLRTFVLPPKINDVTESPLLTEADYNWQLVNIKNETVNLSAFKGKVVFINFWATWCPPCIGEMPAIESLYNQFKNNPDVVFCIVTTDDKTAVLNFLQRKNFTFPVYFAASEIPTKLASNTIPATFLISKNGQIIINQIGAANWSGKKMRNTINRLLKE